MHGQFITETTEKADQEKTWQWLAKGNLKVGTGALLGAAQEQAIRTKRVQHITSGCEKLAQKEYKR